MAELATKRYNKGVYKQGHSSENRGGVALTPEEQLEFHKELSESRYKLIKKLDNALHHYVDSLGSPIGVSGTFSEYIDCLTKLAGVRVHLFRELLDMASLTSTAIALQGGVSGQSTDYSKWLELVDKGAQDEQKEEKK